MNIIPLESMDEALRHERDRLPFNRTSGTALRKLIVALTHRADTRLVASKGIEGPA